MNNNEVCRVFISGKAHTLHVHQENISAEDIRRLVRQGWGLGTDCMLPTEPFIREYFTPRDSEA